MVGVKGSGQVGKNTRAFLCVQNKKVSNNISKCDPNHLSPWPSERSIIGTAHTQRVAHDKEDTISHVKNSEKNHFRQFFCIDYFNIIID